MISPEILQQLYGKWQERLNQDDGELLDKIQIKGQIVTIDAMGTQTAIAKKIRQKRADYVLALKRNRNSLYEDVQEYFSDETFKRDPRKRKLQKTQEKAHGQIETREYYQTEDIKWLSKKKIWKGLVCIIMEKKHWRRLGIHRQNTDISSAV